MRERRQYNESFRRQALEKVYTRDSRSIRSVADDLNMSFGTLRNWMKADKNSSQATAGTRWVPTLSVLGVGGFEVLSGDREHLEDPKVRVYFPEAASWVATWFDERRAVGFSDEEWQRRWASLRAGIRTAHERGVKLLAGTDFLPGAALHWELERFVEAGIEPLEVLRIATEQAAETVGAEDDLGTLEPGKLADIVLLDNNPLEDIRDTQTIWRVIKGGWVFDPEKLRPPESASTIE